MFLGLRTATYRVGDIDKGKAWYSQALGVEPYFDEPFYVGFNVAGYELGLQPGASNEGDKAEGAVAYWGVENACAPAGTGRDGSRGSSGRGRGDQSRDCQRSLRQRLRHH